MCVPERERERDKETWWITVTQIKCNYFIDLRRLVFRTIQKSRYKIWMTFSSIIYDICKLNSSAIRLRWFCRFGWSKTTRTVCMWRILCKYIFRITSGFTKRKKNQNEKIWKMANNNINFTFSVLFMDFLWSLRRFISNFCVPVHFGRRQIRSRIGLGNFNCARQWWKRKTQSIWSRVGIFAITCYACAAEVLSTITR